MVLCLEIQLSNTIGLPILERQELAIHMSPHWQHIPQCLINFYSEPLISSVQFQLKLYSESTTVYSTNISNSDMLQNCTNNVTFEERF
jgi:hypothetical protein